MARNPKKKKPVKPLASSIGNDLATAIKYHQKGLLAPAKKIYQRILFRAPKNPDALHFLGVLLHGQGQSASALTYIQRAIDIQPDYVDAYNNLGNVLRSQGRMMESEQACRKAIEIKPDFAYGYNNLGIALKEQEKFDESAKAYQKAIELLPDYAEAYHNLGNVLIEKDDLEAALLSFRKAIVLNPANAKSYKCMGNALFTAGRIEEAKIVYGEWLQQDSENPVAKHMLVACTGENVPERAPDDYVKKTFDSFADNFDQVLKRLDYRAPLLVFKALQNILSDSNNGLDILDAGCGTGLCASYFKPYAKRLEGVDLSPAMLARARVLNLYDDLITAELTAHLLRNPTSYDLVISADTLCYFGALNKVLIATAQALRSGGRLIFTVEHLQSGDATVGYRINFHGRYCHTQNYVREMLFQAGFRVISMSEEILRNENSQPVAGLVTVACI